MSDWDGQFCSNNKKKTANVCDHTTGHKLLIMDFVLMSSCDSFYDSIDSEYTGLSVQSCVLCIVFVDDICYA